MRFLKIFGLWILSTTVLFALAIVLSHLSSSVNTFLRDALYSLGIVLFSSMFPIIGALITAVVVILGLVTKPKQSRLEMQQLSGPRVSRSLSQTLKDVLSLTGIFFRKPKMTFFVLSVMFSLVISIILSWFVGGLVSSILFLPLLICSLSYGFGFWVKDTVSSPYKFAKKYFGEFYREGSSLMNFIGLSDSVTGGGKFDLAPIPLFPGGKTFLFPGTEIVKVNLSPQLARFKEDRIFVDKVELEIEMEISFYIEKNYFHRFNLSAGGINGETKEEHFNKVFSLFSRTAAQVLRDKIEKGDYTDYVKVINLNKQFIEELKTELRTEENDPSNDSVKDDSNNDNLALTTGGGIKEQVTRPVFMEELGITITRMELEIRAKDPLVQKSSENIIISGMEVQVSENKKKTMKNLGESLADAVKPIINVLSGNKMENAAQVANSSVTLLRSALPGAKIDQSIIDLNDQSGKAGINVRGGQK